MNYGQVSNLMHELGEWLAVSPNPHEWLRLLLSHLNEHQLAGVITVVEELMDGDDA